MNYILLTSNDLLNVKTGYIFCSMNLSLKWWQRFSESLLLTVHDIKMLTEEQAKEILDKKFEPLKNKTSIVRLNFVLFIYKLLFYFDKYNYKTINKFSMENMLMFKEIILYICNNTESYKQSLGKDFILADIDNILPLIKDFSDDNFIKKIKEEANIHEIVT